MKNEFDYIIVGGGSAGCVLANRLSEDGEASVLLAEAGPSDRRWDSWRINMPAALIYNLCDDKYNWNYRTAPQARLGGRRIYCPRGRTLGGSSAINAMAFVRGHALDFERWALEGAQGWSYSETLPYFKKAETYSEGGDAYRGDCGPLRVSAGMRGARVNPLFHAFVEAGAQAGHPQTVDQNGYQQEGFGRMDMTIHNGRRMSAAAAYLRPARARRNLRVLTEARCLGIVWENTRAVGVRIRRRGESNPAVYRAAREVILSAGAINSPQILMLSGVGDGDELRKLGVAPVIDLPGVGRNLQDHLELYIQHECKKPVTLYRATTFAGMAAAGLRWFATGGGPCASAHLEAGAFIRGRADAAHPDIQFHFLPSVVNDHGRVLHPGHAYQAHVGTMRPQSRGRVRLAAADPLAPPLIDPNYLAAESDLADLRSSIAAAREVFAQPAFAEFRGREIAPGTAAQSDAELNDWIRANADTAYHPSCTCKMGGDRLAVVDSQGRVFGADGLRVADASIMPSMTSGNLNAPTIMLAEKIADAIRGRPPPPPQPAPFYRPDRAASDCESPAAVV